MEKYPYSFILNEEDIDILSSIQKFRALPIEQEKPLKTVSILIKKAGKPEIAEHIVESIIPNLKDYQGDYNYILSPILCEAAYEIQITSDNFKGKKENQINKVIEKLGYERLSDKEKEDLQIRVIIDEGDNDLHFILSRLFESEEDVDHSNRKILKNNELKYFGIASINEENRVIIFAKKAEPTCFLDIYQYISLYESFKRFDLHKKDILDLRETITTMQALNFELMHPVMFSIIISYNYEEYIKKGISFKCFVNQVHKFIEENVQKTKVLDMFSKYFDINIKNTTINHNSKEISEYPIKLEILKSKYEKIKNKNDFGVLKDIIDRNIDNEFITLSKLVDYYI